MLQKYLLVTKTQKRKSISATFNSNLLIILLLVWFMVFSYRGVVAQIRITQDELNLLFLEAVYEKKPERVDTLLTLGANVNARDYPGLTALMYAVMGGDRVIINSLLKAGADVNLIDYSGNTVIMHAIQANDTVFVREMLPWFNRINHQNSAGQTALMLASQTGNIDILTVLVNFGANIDKVDDNGATALHYASAWGQFFAVDFLAFHNADIIMKTTRDGSTALHLAAFYGHNEIAGLLIDLGISIEALDSNGNTPLHVAVFGKQLATTWYLLEAGASPLAENFKGDNTLSIAASEKDQEMVELLMQYETPLFSTKNKNSSPLAFTYFYRDIETRKNYKGLIKPRGLYFSEFSTLIGFDFSSFDAMFTSSVGFFEARFNTWITLSYSHRMLREKFLVQRNTGVFYQFREKRSLLAMGLNREWQMLRSKDGVYVSGFLTGVDFGFDFANYRGSSLEPPTGFNFIPNAGIFLNFQNMSLTATYRYYDIKQAGAIPHRFAINLVYRWPMFKLAKPSYKTVF